MYFSISYGENGCSKLGSSPICTNQARQTPNIKNKTLGALIQEQAEVEVTRRLTIIGQQLGRLTPVLAGMDEKSIQQDVPHDTLAVRTGDDVADCAVQCFLGQCVEISTHLLLFYRPALSQVGDGWKGVS